jgi:EAL domain-containing protein (putative c-di-GMP-specific phosphodiesterase class I)
LRWHQADKGFIPPDLFIPIAEESGQIYDIEKWVLEQSCQFMQRLLAKGYDLDHISVDVSGNQSKISGSFLMFPKSLVIPSY